MVASTLVLRRNRALPSVAFRRIAFVHARRLWPIRVLRTFACTCPRAVAFPCILALQLLLRFIEQPSCVILAVSAANQDLANSDALQMARRVCADFAIDPTGTAAQRSTAQRSAVQCKQSPDGRTRTCAHVGRWIRRGEGQSASSQRQRWPDAIPSECCLLLRATV